ncbi:MAG: FAD-dependent oxidoreductase [bacterium]
MGAKAAYDVIIVGAGPAGLFAALELARAGGLKILLLEKGKDLPDRKHDPASILCGWGGAGAYSDGKLTLSPDVGGQLHKYVSIEKLNELIAAVDAEYVRRGASDKIYGGDPEALADVRSKASLAHLKLIVTRIRHIGTEVCLDVLGKIREELLPLIDFKAETMAMRVLVEGRRAVGVETTGGEAYRAKTVILAPGREGSEWLSLEAKRLDLPRENNPVDIGVRVETHAAVMEPLTKILYESKFLFNTKKFDDMIRTFCMCPNGEVVLEENNGVTTVNGHSYSNRNTDNTNFALLVSNNFTKPFHEPIAYGKYVASLANLLGGGVLAQRLGDLRNGRRSTPARIEKGSVVPTLKKATPGDLSFVLPYRHLSGIIEMLEALDQVAPGINSRSTLLYGVEVKFYSSRVELNENLETPIENLYAVGDGAGITRGLVQASASGIIAGRAVLEKHKG